MGSWKSKAAQLLGSKFSGGNLLTSLGPRFILGIPPPVQFSLARPFQQRVNSLLYLQLHFKDTKLKQVIYSPHTRKSN